MTAARLEIPVIPDWDSVVEAFVRSGAGRFGMPADGAARFAEAARRIAGILLRQEFHPDHASLQAELRPIAGGLQLVFRDQGVPFNAEMWTSPELTETLGSVRRNVDKLEFVNQGLDGKETRLLRFASLQQDCQEAPPFRATAPFREVRPFRPPDAEGVARCVWRTYGYSYSVLDAVYIPDRLTALNASGHMHSIVALNEAEEVIGHLAFEREDPRSDVAVGGVAVVEPAYRSQGIASRLGERLVLEARASGVREFQCYAVTSHPYSQRLVNAYGFRCCALVLGASLFSFEGMDVSGQPRESLIGYYLDLHPQKPRAPRTLYAPNRHRAMLESLCLHLGVPVHFEVPDEPTAQAGESVVHLEESPPRKTAKIHVRRYGSNALERLRAHARYLRLQDYRCCQLTLPLQDPNTYFVLKPIERMGFFFSGLTFRSDGLCLLMQDLHGVTIDYSRLQVEDEMAQELLSYVRTMEPEPV